MSRLTALHRKTEEYWAELCTALELLSDAELDHMVATNKSNAAFALKEMNDRLEDAKLHLNVTAERMLERMGVEELP